MDKLKHVNSYNATITEQLVSSSFLSRLDIHINDQVPDDKDRQWRLCPGMEIKTCKIAH